MSAVEKLASGIGKEDIWYFTTRVFEETLYTNITELHRRKDDLWVASIFYRDVLKLVRSRSLPAIPEMCEIRDAFSNERFGLYTELHLILLREVENLRQTAETNAVAFEQLLVGKLNTLKEEFEAAFGKIREEEKRVVSENITLAEVSSIYCSVLSEIPFPGVFSTNRIALIFKVKATMELLENIRIFIDNAVNGKFLGTVKVDSLVETTYCESNYGMDTMFNDLFMAQYSSRSILDTQVAAAPQSEYLPLDTIEAFRRDFGYLLPNDSDWEIDDFIVPGNPHLSAGAFGIVASGKAKLGSKKEPKSCVLKFTRPFLKWDKDRDCWVRCGNVLFGDFIREFEIMKYVKDNIQNQSQLLSTKSLLRMYDGHITKYIGNVEGVFIVEHLHGGDLWRYLDDKYKKKGYVNENYLREVLLPVFQAIQLLHDHRIVHNDLKIENLVFRDAKHSDLVIVDFGLAYQLRWPNERQLNRPRFSTSANQMNFSPEQKEANFQDQVISPANDIYAMGHMLNFIVGYFGFRTGENSRFVSRHIKSLIERMMCPSMMDRCSIEDVLSSSWLTCNPEDLMPPVFVSMSGSKRAQLQLSPALEYNKYKPNIKEICAQFNVVKEGILSTFANLLKPFIWSTVNGQLRLTPVAVPTFNNVLDQCTGLSMFQVSVLPLEDENGVHTPLDLNGDGQIDYHEIILFLRLLGLFSPMQLVVFQFNLFDRNCCGEITEDLISCIFDGFGLDTVSESTEPTSCDSRAKRYRALSVDANAANDSLNSSTDTSPRSAVTPRSLAKNEFINCFISYRDNDLSSETGALYACLKIHLMRLNSNVNPSTSNSDSVDLDHDTPLMDLEGATSHPSNAATAETAAADATAPSGDDMDENESI